MSAYCEDVNSDNSEDDYVSYDYLIDWCKKKETSRPQFRIWRSILNLELIFVCAIIT